MSLPESLRTRLEIAKFRVREYVFFDSFLFRWSIALGVPALAFLMRLMGRRLRAARTMAAVHRADYAHVSNELAARYIGKELEARGADDLRGQYLADLRPAPNTARYFADPEGTLIGKRILVLKSPRDNERGIVMIDYSYVFSLFAKLYDIDAIMRRYSIVLEPTWSGYCDFDILCFDRHVAPVFVQSAEPRDTAILRRLANKLVTVPIAGNWWVDHRTVHPIAGTVKDVDVIMVGSWAAFKRHNRFFSVLRDLRRRGHALKVVLIGYPAGLQKEDILSQAKFYGIADQLEVHEWLSPDQVNVQFNRARINIIWSRREGFNRAVVEGLFAGLPCIMRTGFNYGWHLPYVNPSTGCFARESDLADTMLTMLDQYESYRTREWALANMSCQEANRILSTAMRDGARALGERWTEDPVLKVCFLNNMAYWEPKDRDRFDEDYAFLKSTRRA